MKRGVSKSKIFNSLNIILIGLLIIELLFVGNWIATGNPVRSATLDDEGSVVNSASSFQQTYGKEWKIETNKDNTIVKLSGGNVPIEQITGKKEKITTENIDSVSKTFINKNNNLLKVDSPSLKVSKIFSDTNSKMKVIRYEQEYQGVQIYNSYTTLAYSGEALTYYKTNYETQSLDINPIITKEKAFEVVEKEYALGNLNLKATNTTPDLYGFNGNYDEGASKNIAGKSSKEASKIKSIVNIQNPENSVLVIFPLSIAKGQGNKLAWKIDLPLDKINNQKMTYFIDAKTGNILYLFDNVVYETVSGNVKGRIYPNTPTDGFEIRSFNHERVKFVNDESYTNNGSYLINTAEANGKVEGGLNGLYVYVNNYQQPNAHFQSNILTPSAIQNIDWSVIDTSYKQEESNLFYHANIVHDFFTKGGTFDIYTLDYPMIANVEIPAVCNAYADGSSINFYMAGDVPGWGFCEATSLGSDIIYHEYTHNVVFSIYNGINLPYVGQTGGMNEGWADYFAATITNDPVMGENIFPTPIRNLENNLRYPNDYNPEPHVASTVFSPALWEIRQSIGVETADAMILNAMKLTPMTFSEFVEAMLVSDDDNGNLEDGTPHINDICHAFWDNHGIFSSYCKEFVETPIISVTSPLLGEVVVGSIPIIGEIYPSKYGINVEYTIKFGDVEFGNYGGEEFIGSLGNISTILLSDGINHLTIDALDSGGKLYSYSIPLDVDNLQVTSLKEGEILRPGEIIEIKGSVILNDNERYSLQWIGGNVSMWTTEGITLVNDGLTSVQNDTLGFWDTTNLQSGSYALNLWKLGEGGTIIPDDSWISLYFDSSLKEGWPIKMEWPIYDCPNPYGCMYWSGDLAPVVEDINKDNIKEIIIAIRPNKIFVFEPDGTSLAGFPKELPFNRYGGDYGMSNPIPVVGDINNDGFKEIFVQGHQNDNNDFFSLIIYGFNYDGTPIEGWLTNTQTNYLGQQMSNSPVIVDVNNDGFSEIIAQSYQKLIVFDRFGNLLNQNWPIEIIPSIGGLSTPAVGNLDTDPELEIVATSSTSYDGGNSVITKIYAFNLDGSSVPGWPIEKNSVVYGSPVIGDVNNDGNNEIVIGFFDIFDEGNLGGVYVLKNNGELLPNWPQLTDKSIFSSPALKKNSAGILDIIVETFPKVVPPDFHEVWLFNYSGQGRLINSSPYVGGNVFSPILVDVNNDSEVDIITASPNQVLAFSNLGQIMPGFTKQFPEADNVMTSFPIIDDIDNDNKLELVKGVSSYRWDSINVWDLDTPYNKKTIEWPQYQHDPQHTGLYTSPSVCADLNHDGVRDILDVSLLINHAFRNGPEPQPKWIGDLDANNVIDIMDVILMINHAFRNGPVPTCTAVANTTTSSSATGTISISQGTSNTDGTSNILVYSNTPTSIAGEQFKLSYSSDISITSITTATGMDIYRKSTTPTTSGKGETITVLSSGSKTIKGNTLLLTIKAKNTKKDYSSMKLQNPIVIDWATSKPYKTVNVQNTIQSPPQTKPATCTDSDKGKTYNIKGTLTVTNSSGTFNYQDACISTTKLKEFYCNNNQAAFISYTCPYGCLDGMCKVQAKIVRTCTKGKLVCAVGKLFGYYQK